MKNELVSHDTVDWLEQIGRDNYPEISVDWTIATPSNTPAQLISIGHGTMIRVTLSRERSFIARRKKILESEKLEKGSNEQRE